MPSLTRTTPTYITSFPLLNKPDAATAPLITRMSGPSHGCQTGLQFYTCKSNGFLGCCSVDPCTLSGCPVSDDGNNSDTDVATTRVGESISADSTPSSVGPSTFSTATSTLTQHSSASAATTSTPFEIATLLAPPFVGAASSAEGYSTVLITSFLLVSQEILTPTSSGVALTPTSSMVTSTTHLSLSISTSTVQGSTRPSTSTSTPASAAPSSTDTPPAPASHPSSHTSAIAGSVGGVGGLVVAALLIWLLLRWQRLRKEEAKRVFQLDDDPRLQGIDANRAGSAFKESDGKCRPRLLQKPSPSSPGLSQATSTSRCGSPLNELYLFHASS